MKLLITGHRGLLGSACVRHFKNFHDVRTTENLDLLQEGLVRRWMAANKPEAVIHCAAKVGGVKANRDYPADFIVQNLKMQQNVITACHDFGVKHLLFMATSCMFPKNAALPVKESSLFTGSLEDSVEAYAIAKIAGWRMCKAYYEQHGDKFWTLAPANIYGLNDNYGESAHVIPGLIRRYVQACKASEPLTVWGDGSQVREFIFADDVARAIECVLTASQNGFYSPEVVSVGTGIGTTVKELVGHITSVSEGMPKVDVKWDTSQPSGIPRKTFDISRISSLGFKPTVGLKEGLKLALNDYLTGTPRQK
jgi:GDP-L-fucose synthase